MPAALFPSSSDVQFRFRDWIGLLKDRLLFRKINCKLESFESSSIHHNRAFEVHASHLRNVKLLNNYGCQLFNNSFLRKYVHHAKQCMEIMIVDPSNNYMKIETLQNAYD